MSVQRKKAASPASTGKKQVCGDIATRFKPGQSGNPAGRKPGSRNRLSEAFISALAADFEENGAAAIAKVRENSPVAYLRVIASLAPARVEVSEASAFDDMSDEQLDQWLSGAHEKLRALKSQAH
jgi:hypothetical protein